MPSYDPTILANILRLNGSPSDADRAYLNTMNAGLSQLNSLAGQGQITNKERAMAQQALNPSTREAAIRQAMQQIQSLGQGAMQGMGQMTDADRAFLLNQGK